MNRIRSTRAAMGVMVAVVALAGCGGGRNMDNPPPDVVGPGSLETSTTTTTLPTVTAFIPSTAPTTLAPPTNPPPQPTYAPTVPPVTPAPTSATLPPVSTTGQTYSIVSGDTLSGIARKLGVPMSELLSANGMNASSLIQPGDHLQIPVGGTPPTTAPTTGGAATNPGTTGVPATSPATTAGPATNPATNPATTAAPAPTTTFAPPANAVVPNQTAASCQAPGSTEANGNPIDFNPGNVLDHNPATAWRCAVGEDQNLTFTFSAAVHLDSVGLIGGYVKVDALTGVDRFPQNFRVRQVRWTFSDGTTVTQDLSDSRGMQTLAVDVVTTSVTMDVLATYPSTGADAKQMVAVGEVQFTGNPA